MSTGAIHSRLGSIGSQPAVAPPVRGRPQPSSSPDLNALAGANSFDDSNRSALSPAQTSIARILTTPLSTSVATEFAGMNVGPTATREENVTAINLAYLKAYGTPPDAGTVDYWLRKFDGREVNVSGYVTSGQMTSTDYWFKRLIGWQAGGRDVAQFGPWAGSGSGGPNGNGRVPGSGPASSSVLASLAHEGRTAEGLYSMLMGSALSPASRQQQSPNTDASREVQRRRRVPIAA